MEVSQPNSLAWMSRVIRRSLKAFLANGEVVSLYESISQKAEKVQFADVTQ